MDKDSFYEEIKEKIIKEKNINKIIKNKSSKLNVKCEICEIEKKTFENMNKPNNLYFTYISHFFDSYNSHNSQNKHNSHNSHNSQNIYDVDLLLELVYQIKDKIIIYCVNEEKNSKELAELLEIKQTAILNHIRRNKKEDDSYTGLVPGGFIDVIRKEGKTEYYKTSKKGIKRIIEIQEKFEEKEEKIRQQKQQEEQKAFEQEQERKRTEEKIEYIKDFINLYYESKVEQKELIRINFLDILNYDPDLASDVLENFLNTKTKFELAFRTINEEFDNIVSFYNIPKTEMIPISALDYNNFDKLVMIEGLIRSRSERKPKITKEKYSCKLCGKTLYIIQKDRFLLYPKIPCLECGKKAWNLDKQDLITVQRLEVEEFSENLEGVNEPRSVNLLLQNDLCKHIFQKHFNPGTRIKFWGLLKSEQTYTANRKNTMLDYYIEVNGFEVLEQSLEFNVTEKEQNKILEYSKRKDIMKLLINSFAPEIFGNKACKHALLLSAVKGYVQLPKYKRDRIHVMFVGNPGSGKTVMVKKLIELTKLSRFASGLNSSKVGLMAAVVQDKFIGGYKLSAGAVPLANNGICAIDEFDKIPDEDKKAMNSAMEEGEIIVDKASIHQKLLANTTIVSTCNPKGERFEEENQYYNQYNLPKSLVDRFDLIFVVNADVFDNPFLEVIKDNENECIEEDLLSKYIIMAQNHIPKVSKEIEIYLATKGGEFKQKWKSFNYIFGFRQFNSVRNIMFAIARLKLIKKVTKKEVDEAFKLYETSVESQQYKIM